MKTFTIERTYLVPIFQHVTVEAETLEAAIADALDDNEHSWDSAQRDDEGSRRTYVSGAWEDADAYCGDALNVPIANRDWSQELAGGISPEETETLLRALHALGKHDAGDRAACQALYSKIVGDAPSVRHIDGGARG